MSNKYRTKKEEEYHEALKSAVVKPGGHKMHPEFLPLFGVLHDGAPLSEQRKLSGSHPVFLESDDLCPLRDLAGKGPTWLRFMKPYTDPTRNIDLPEGIYLVWETTEMERVLPERRLYTVTTLASSPVFGGTRTPVICDTFKEAEEIVLGNAGDIWESSYMFAVIEGVEPNVLYSHTTAGEQYWYAWIDGGFKPIECPEMFRGTVGFGIG